MKRENWMVVIEGLSEGYSSHPYIKIINENTKEKNGEKYGLKK